MNKFDEVLNAATDMIENKTKDYIKREQQRAKELILLAELADVELDGRKSRASLDRCKDEIVLLCREGKSQIEIANEINCDLRTLAKYMQKHQLKTKRARKQNAV